MKLIASSTPGMVERWEAIQHLSERAVLTRLVCRELLELRDERFSHWRTNSALRLLAQWKSINLAEEPPLEGSSGDDRTKGPDDCKDVLAEISDGERVCSALRMLGSADNDSEYSSDLQRLNAELERYWQKHPIAVFPPSVKN